MTDVIKLSLAAVAVLFVAFAISSISQTSRVYGSISTGEEYQATTTFAGHTDTDGVRLLKTGQGSLNAVVITGDNTGLISIYNATTSDVTQRAANKASSTILIADFPASAPEGTYTFDAAFTDGLLLVQSGAEATSTVTFR